MPVLRPEAVLLRVTDLPVMQGFYRDLLGAPARAVVLRDAPDGRPRPPGAPGLYHVALLVPDRESLGRVLARLLDAGERPDGGADHAVSEALYLHDPEGNGIEIYADRPAEGWRWCDGQVAMDTTPLDWQGLLRLGRSLGPAALPEGTRVGHVHLQVSDLARSHAFYGALGLETTARWNGEAVFLASGRYHHHVGLNTWASRGAGPAPAGSRGLEEVCFAGAAQDSVTADPDGIRVRLRAA